METLRFDLSKEPVKFKIMNAVNNGPTAAGNMSNFEYYKAARIPYARNHDAGAWYGIGGSHVVDITGIFSDFDADVNDPASYDFLLTDNYILRTLEAGTQTYYRLGQTIEHWPKKYGAHPPKDFNKWAQICEHIIRHYNEGWADGYELNIEYWEIWNEPDLSREDTLPETRPCWTGSAEEFYELYAITATHLKKCFPNVMIGSPAISQVTEPNIIWFINFLERITKEHVPMDFLSWHQYWSYPEEFVKSAVSLRSLLDKYGYINTLSFLTEWNYTEWLHVEGEWYGDANKRTEVIHGIKGAAFTMATMSACQHAPVDMLMYYDARPCLYNGLFDYYSLKPLKGYYPIKWYGMFYDMVGEIVCDNEIPNIYSLCGIDEKGKTLSVITYYSNEDSMPDKTFSVDFGKDAEYEIYLLDETHDAELVDTTKALTFTMKQNTCIMIKEK